MNRLEFSLALVVIFSVNSCLFAQEAPSICNDGKCIQVGSQNIELLGSSRKRYGGVERGKRSDAELEAMANRLATQLDLEIIVFQEINKHSEEWATLKAKLAAKGYKFAEGNSSDRNQYVVLAWDADEVTAIEEPKELDVRAKFDLGDGCKEEGLRKPMAGRFKAGEFDFWVIGVHLKSRSGEESCTKRIRNEQCKDLVAKINQITASSGERDVLIVGDFNENIGHSSFQPLVDAGFTSQMKFLRQGSAEGSYVKNGNLNESDDLIDHVWIRYSETQEVVRRSAFAMPLKANEVKPYIISQSDHVPVWVSFRTDEDLDDE